MLIYVVVLNNHAIVSLRRRQAFPVQIASMEFDALRAELERSVVENRLLRSRPRFAWDAKIWTHRALSSPSHTDGLQFD